jgi:hypothetical protein
MKGLYVNALTRHKEPERFSQPLTLLPKRTHTFFIADSLASSPLQVKAADIQSHTRTSFRTKKQTGTSTIALHLKKAKARNTQLHYSKQSLNNFSWSWIFFLAGFSAVSFIGMNYFFSTQLMKIKSWASRNKAGARLIMIFTKIALGFFSFIIGYKFFELDVRFPDYAGTIFSLAYITGILIYPFRRSYLEKGFSIIRKKACELALSVAGLLMCLNFGNHIAQDNFSDKKDHNIIRTLTARYLDHTKNIKDDGTVKKHFSILDDTDKADTVTLKVTLSVLTILFSILLQIAIIYFSCMLACSGAEGLAQLVLYGGSALLIAGCVFAFIGISKIEVKHKETTE